MVGTHSALVLNALNQANKSVPHLIYKEKHVQLILAF